MLDQRLSYFECVFSFFLVAVKELRIYELSNCSKLVWTRILILENWFVPKKPTIEREEWTFVIPICFILSYCIFDSVLFLDAEQSSVEQEERYMWNEAKGWQEIIHMAVWWLQGVLYAYLQSTPACRRPNFVLFFFFGYSFFWQITIDSLLCTKWRWTWELRSCTIEWCCRACLHASMLHTGMIICGCVQCTHTQQEIYSRTISKSTTIIIISGSIMIIILKQKKKYTKKWARKRWTAHDTRKIDHKHKNKQFCPMIYQRK